MQTHHTNDTKPNSFDSFDEQPVKTFRFYFRLKFNRIDNKKKNTLHTNRNGDTQKLNIYTLTVSQSVGLLCSMETRAHKHIIHLYINQ